MKDGRIDRKPPGTVRYASTTIGTNDDSTMSVGLANLPGGDLFAANADRDVSDDLGLNEVERIELKRSRGVVLAKKG